MAFQKGQLITREQAQMLAVAEAQRGAGFVSPNPLVGCVIVDSQHRFLSSGYHAKYGDAHAEIHALSKLAPGECGGATVYVTLEPCSHFGKTPPCARRLVQESPERVVVGLQDPNPQVAGEGLAALRAAGIAVEVDETFGRLCRRMCEHFLWHIQNKKPFVTLKIAASLDGQVALTNGASQWITSEEARREARRMRGEHDATLIGARTFCADDPLLDLRDTVFAGKKLNRIVIWDPNGSAEKFWPSSRLSKSELASRVYFLKTAALDEAALQELYRQNIYSLWVEGGAHTISEFLKNGHFQKLVQFIGPRILGAGRAWGQGLHFERMDETIAFEIFDVQRLGPDLMVTSYPAEGK